MMVEIHHGLNDMRNLCTALLLIVCLSCLGCRELSSAPRLDASQVFSAEQVRDDLHFLRDAAIRRHPRFHDQEPGVDFIQAFDAVERELSQPMSRSDAFRALALVNPAFQDAHTLLMPTSAIDPVAEAGKFFPIAVRIGRDSELLVEGAWMHGDGRMQLAAGTRIRQINGLEAASLIEELSRYGHGETVSLRGHMLGVMFPAWLAAIKGWTGEFVLEVEKDGQRRTLVIRPGDNWTSAAPGESSDLPSLHSLGQGAALLKVPTFDVDEMQEAYRTAVAKSFSTLRNSGAEVLVIDVRGNTGGQSDAGAEILRFLVDRPVNQVSSAQERLNEDNRGLFGYKGRIGEMREMDLSKDGLVEPAPEAERYNGRVFLLIDEMTYSAGILFATALQDHALATLVGRPTGGFANQTGNMEEVRLPNTGFVANIPARVFVRPSGDTRLTPVIPDIVATGESGDDALEKALNIILDPQHSREINLQGPSP